MSFKTDSATARTIGIDTAKYTLHMIGLNEKGTIVGQYATSAQVGIPSNLSYNRI